MAGETPEIPETPETSETPVIQENQQTRQIAQMPDTTNTVTTRRLAGFANAFWGKINTAKADKVSGANGNVAIFDSNGNLDDSHKTPADFATSAQGAAADTAVQSVKLINNSGIELKNGTSVIIPVAIKQGETGETAGIITAEDKKKLDEIDAGADVNQNAYSVISVATPGGTTNVSATTETDTITLTAGNFIGLTANTGEKKITIGSTLDSLEAASGNQEKSLVTRNEKYIWGNKQDALTFSGTYSSATNPVALVSTITDSVSNLSGSVEGLSANKTITSLTESNGIIQGTTALINIAESQVNGLEADLSAKAPLIDAELSGTPTAPNPNDNNRSQIATVDYVSASIEEKLEEADALSYKGSLAGGDTGSYGALTPSAKTGYTYKVSTSGMINGIPVEAGDMLICNHDTAAATTTDYSTVVNNWDYIQTNLDGVVTGPSAAAAGTIAAFADSTGKVITSATSAQIREAAGLENVRNVEITIDSTTGVSDGTNTYVYTHPTATSASAAAVKVGVNETGHVIIGGALGKGDVGLGNVDNTADLDKQISTATQAALDNKVDKVQGKQLSDENFTSAYKDKLEGISTGAEVNQNAFSVIKSGQIEISAGTPTDKVEFIGSTHITITNSNSNNNKTVTFSTDLSNKTSAQGNSEVSLVTRDEKYIWSSKQDALNTYSAYTSAGSSTKVPQITTNSYGQVTEIIEVPIEGVAPAAHTHGNITSGGALTTDIPQISNGDKLVITDADDSNKIARATIAFDGSSTDSALTPKGTWQTFVQPSAINALSAEVTSTDGNNVQVKVTETAGKITAVNITTDNTETSANKVSAFQTTPDNTHYPTEKLVKDNLDLKANKSEMSVSAGTGSDTDKTTITLKTGTSATVLTAHQDITGKAEKSEMVITSVAGDSTKKNIQLKSGLSADVVTEHQDISGKAEKSEMSITPGTGTTTIQLKAGTSAIVLTAHQNISGKADIVSNSTSGDFAGLDNNGNLIDSGFAAGDFATSAQGALAETAVQDVKIGNTSIVTSNIATIPDATTAAKGVVQLLDSHSSTSTSMAATPKNVKEAYDLANGKYTLPANGIPSSDLASGVTASLALADSSIQGIKLEGAANPLTASNGVVTIPNAIATTAGNATNGLMTAADKLLLDSITSGAEPNQDAFSYVTNGTTTISAADASDTLTISGGGATTVSLNAGSKKITVSSTDQSVSAAQYHYTPTTSAGASVSASATGAQAAWSIDVVKGVTLSTDGRGHVTGITVESGKIPANPISDVSQAFLGQGYSENPTLSSSTFTVTMQDYVAADGGIVAIQFNNNVPANAQLNINSEGAKPVYYHGQAIIEGVIQQGDIAYFMYDGTNYVLLGCDRSVMEMTETEVNDIINALT